MHTDFRLSRFVLIAALLLLSIPRAGAQQLGVSFGFPINVQAKSIAEEDNLCRQACAAVSWSEAWMPLFGDERVTQCGAKVNHPSIHATLQPIVAVVQGTPRNFAEATRVCARAFEGIARYAFGQCHMPNGGICNRPAGADTGHNQTPYFVGCTCSATPIGDGTRPAR